MAGFNRARVILEPTAPSPDDRDEYPDERLPTYEEAVYGIRREEIEPCYDTPAYIPEMPAPQYVQTDQMTNDSFVPTNTFDPVVYTFGSQGSDIGQFRSPAALAVDPSNGNIVVTDTSNHRIQIFSSDFRCLGAFGEEGHQEGQLKHPNGVAVDEYGYIYVSDNGNHRIQVFDFRGKLHSVIGRKGNAVGELSFPCGIIIGSNGLIYVCDSGNKRMLTFRKDGFPVNAFGGDLVSYFSNNPRHIAAYKDGTLAVTDWTNQVTFFQPSGEYISTLPGSAETGLVAASGIAVADNDDIFLVDKPQGKVHVLRATGDKSLLVPTSTELSYPAGAALTLDGHLLVADMGKHRLLLLRTE